VVLGAGLLLWLLPALLGLAGGVTPEVASTLAQAARPPVSLPVPGEASPLLGRTLDFQRVTVTEETPDRARAVSTLDFEGTCGPIRVSSLGREATRFQRRGAGWQLDGSLAPTLVAAVAVLSARRRGLETGDAGSLSELVRPEDRERVLADPTLQEALARALRYGPIQAWYLRFEAGEVTVTEEEGQPIRLHRLRLVPKKLGALEFVFAGSLL
jgi:hypothetical protein